MTLVIGTAGHIDHGKTRLLRALTGIDADRLPEERARGMTIDVGYAHLTLPDGTELDFVDVPGQDRLVGNMLVGAGEIDAALLVIAADDGPRPQTLEHLELLDALGIDRAVVAVTKCDLVSADRAEEVAGQAADLIATTALHEAAICVVSASTGAGLDGLTQALAALRDRDPADSHGSAPRLAIDRVFTIRGRGTVVTGSLRGGIVERGAILRVIPGPADATVRVREVQVHGRAVERAIHGRVALNVAGEGLAALERGTVLTDDPAVAPTSRILVALRPTGDALRDRIPITAHLGTARVSGVLGWSGRDAVELGSGEVSAIVRLDRPIAAAPGDRLVVRRSSPVETIAGGRVLDPTPPTGMARRRTTADRVRALAAASRATEPWHAARLDLHGFLATGSGQLAPDLEAALVASLVAEAAARPDGRLSDILDAAILPLRRVVGREAPGGPGGSRNSLRRIAARQLDALVAAGVLVRAGDRVRPAGVSADGPDPEAEAAMDRLVAALSEASPPSLREAAASVSCRPEGIRALEQAGRIVVVDDDLAWATTRWRRLAEQALAIAAVEPLTPAAYRDATGTSRKYVMALLEDLDRRAILRRTPAGHVPGPRAGSLDEPGRAPVRP